MANISQIKKLAYTVHTSVGPAFEEHIPILWDSPFNDTNYAIEACVEVLTQSDQVSSGFGSSINILGITDVTREGFTLNVSDWSAVNGDQWVIHAIASHR